MKLEAVRYCSEMHNVGPPPGNAWISLHSTAWHLIASVRYIKPAFLTSNYLLLHHTYRDMSWAQNHKTVIIRPHFIPKHSALHYQQFKAQHSQKGRLLRQLQYVNALRVPTFSSKCCLSVSLSFLQSVHLVLPCLRRSILSQPVLYH